MKKNIYIYFAGFCLGITPYLNWLVNVQRGYTAFGGECFIPLVPLIIWLLKDKGDDDEK